MPQEIQFKKVCKDADATVIIPTKGTPDSAGFDFSAPIENTIYPNTTTEIRTGLAVKIPVGYYGKLEIRSSLARRYGLSVLAGVIDSDYRGEIIILVTKLGTSKSLYSIKKGERFAQMVIIKCHTGRAVEVKEFRNVTHRGTGGFGSTGKF